MKKITFLFLLLCSCKTLVYKEAPTTLFPENTTGIIINDYSDILSPAEERSLTQKLLAYEEETTRQIAVVTIDSITPYQDIKDYAVGIGAYWGVGQKGKDNGLVIAVSNKLRTIGIATGLGTEKQLTDAICKQVIESTFIPHFREGNYYQGISNGLDSLIYKWN